MRGFQHQGSSLLYFPLLKDFWLDILPANDSDCLTESGYKE